MLDRLAQELEQLKKEHLYKYEQLMHSPQSSKVTLTDNRQVINFCANNYLGLSDDPQLIDAAKQGLDTYGFGLSSVRFICGTQQIHKQLEAKLAHLIGSEDVILYSSCFDANGGLFATLLGKEDAIISDELNHASIIDGIKLCAAKRYIYKNNDMDSLKQQLVSAKDARLRLIATDGVFSMDGLIANLPAICDLAKVHDAWVMVDDCHATGILGEKGSGTAEYYGMQGEVDLTTSTMGKALGGASGGFTGGKKIVIDYLRQKSRPYLFSNSLAPPIVAATLSVVDFIQNAIELRSQLHDNARLFRQKMSELRFDLVPGNHPIVPVMLHDESVATTFADELLTCGIYVVPFSYPVVPKGKARVRVQLSAAHTKENVIEAIEAFAQVGRKLGVIL